MSIHEQLVEIGKQARAASYQLAKLSTEQKNSILKAMAEALREQADDIKSANADDVSAAEQANTASALIDRLRLDDKRINAMADGLQQIASLNDPVGELLKTYQHPNGMTINKIRVPIGVIGIIYESRPNVTADVSGLCLKTANAVILRGGRDAFHSNQAIISALLKGGKKAGMPEHAIQFINNTDRAAVKELVQLEGYVDLVIPRGGESLIRTVVDLAKVPIIKHYKGLCHTYVDKNADLEMALNIIENAKCQRPGVCNAMETLLVHKDIAADLIPKLVNQLSKHGVELRGDANIRKHAKDIITASDADWDTEYLDLILSIKSVNDLQQAIDHINQHGSQHSDAIISNDEAAQQEFVDSIDSAAVFVNASTRFNDGGEFGMGAEMGISTDKLHARGPMGLEELTTYKYVILGQGQIRN